MSSTELSANEVSFFYALIAPSVPPLAAEEKMLHKSETNSIICTPQMSTSSILNWRWSLYGMGWDWDISYSANDKSLSEYPRVFLNGLPYNFIYFVFLLLWSWLARWRSFFLWSSFFSLSLKRRGRFDEAGYAVAMKRCNNYISNACGYTTSLWLRLVERIPFLVASLVITTKEYTKYLTTLTHLSLSLSLSDLCKRSSSIGLGSQVR